ncbi:hypothetical protein P8452_70032 [Trifolium repens]|nr:hypothetical protein P8452_70032 [Trifolium repens]
MSDDCYWSLGTGLATISFEVRTTQMLPFPSLLINKYHFLFLDPYVWHECFTDPSNKEQIEQRMCPTFKLR